MSTSAKIIEAVRPVLLALLEAGDAEHRGYVRCGGTELLGASKLTLAQFRDAVGLARGAGLIIVDPVIPTSENGNTGVHSARLSPKGRELLAQQHLDTASPLADARTVKNHLAVVSRDGSATRGLDSDALAKHLSWAKPRLLEAADVLVAQGEARFARRTMSNFFVLELTPTGRL